MAIAPRRQLGLFDATMIVMGGIVGAGIFINPYVVAQQLHAPRISAGVCSCCATTYGLMKMPAPTMPPITIMVASNRPTWRSSPGGDSP